MSLVNFLLVNRKCFSQVDMLYTSCIVSGYNYVTSANKQGWNKTRMFSDIR